MSLACAVSVFCLFAQQTSAQVGSIFGVSHGFVPGTAPVVQINPQTGQYTTVNTLGYSYNSLAQNSAGEFFGGWFSVTASNGRVSRFDPNTGAQLQTYETVTPGAGDIRGLSFDSTDSLYAVLNRDDNQVAPTLDDDLYYFDLTNETTALIGSLGFSGVQGFDISPADQFYAWDIREGLLTIDPSTGNATDVNPNIGGTGDIQSIVFSSDGQLFGARRNLYSINIATGAFTQIGTGADIDLRGIEYVVPEPSTAILLGLMTVSHLLFTRRSR